MNSESKAKKKYNDKAYDQFFVQFPKGTKEILDEFLANKEDELLLTAGTKYASKTTYLYEALNKLFKEDTGKTITEEILTRRKKK